MLPLALAAPASVAALSYLEAKHRLSTDLWLLWLAVKAPRYVDRLEKAGRLNIFYILEQHATNPKTANNVLLYHEGQEWTYKQALELSLKWGTYLKQKHNIGPEEMVALDCMNRPAYLWITFGLWSIGATVALINYNLTDKPLLHSVKMSTARLLLVDQDVKGAFTSEIMDEFSSPDFRTGLGATSGRKDMGGSVTIEFIDEDLQHHVSLMEPIREPDSVRDPKDHLKVALLIYTSGTTGLPKPASISWGRLHRILQYIPKLLRLKTTDRFYTCMPLYHSAGMILGLLCTLEPGAGFVLGRRFSTKTFWSECCNSKATVFQYVGETCRYLLSAPPSPLDRAHNIHTVFGNGLRPDIWNKFKNRFGIDTIVEFYGATEGAGSLWNVSRNDFTMGAVGRTGSLLSLLQGKNAAVVEVDPATETPARDPETGFCTRLLPNNPARGETPRPGEMLFLLPAEAREREAIYAGYFGNKKATDSKVMTDVFTKGDAWFRSGDMISRDTEGRSYFHDRIGDTFRWRSENVSTNEVADAIGQHSAIDEANVYGVEVPGHDGRAGCAAVILTGSDSSSSSPSLELSSSVAQSLASHAFKMLPKYAVPIFIRVTPTIERTGTNKQVKHVLRAQGIELDKIKSSGDRMYWLNPKKEGGAAYVPFEPKDLSDIKAGQVKL